jgi:hypothetical protein
MGVQLFDQYGQRTAHTPEGSQDRLSKLDALVLKATPALAAHLVRHARCNPYIQHGAHMSHMQQRLNIATVLFALKWIRLRFVESVPLDVVWRIWDMLFLEGHDVIICAAASILAMLEKELLEAEEMAPLLILYDCPSRSCVWLVYSLLMHLQATACSNWRTTVPLVWIGLWSLITGCAG